MGKGAQLFIILIVVVVSCAGLDDGPPAAAPARLCTRQRIMRIRRKRVIVYMRDEAHHIDEDQLRQVADLCAGRGYDPVATVQEEPGQISGLIDALRMVRRGEADRIVMASRDQLPDLIESATGEVPGLAVGELPDGRGRAPRHRRIWPTRRGGGAA